MFIVEFNVRDFLEVIFVQIEVVVDIDVFVDVCMFERKFYGVEIIGIDGGVLLVWGEVECLI